MQNKVISSRALFLIALIGGIWTVYLSHFFIRLEPIWKIQLGLVSFLFFYFLSRWLVTNIKRSFKAFNKFLDNTSIEILLGGTGGLFLGIIAGLLSSYPLSMIRGVGIYLTLGVFFISIYMGVKIGTRRAYDVFGLFPFLNSDQNENNASAGDLPYKVLDTSAIIDGRIYDVCLSNFLEGLLIVPLFVLDELQHIADSSDNIRRNKGRRGLELLSKMQKHPRIKIDIIEDDILEEKEVDSKLIRLCKQINASIITNDYNLNKVAELQDIKVLNINELINAVKVIVYPGETMSISIIKAGKEAGQGVGYLEDGTMVVVENAQNEIGTDLEVMVTSVFQTAAGRMIFSRKIKEEKQENIKPGLQDVQEVNLFG